jgi:hypothetical protein
LKLKYQQERGPNYNFWGMREKKKILIGDKPNYHYRHAPHHQEENITTLPTTWRKSIFGRQEASYALSEVHEHLPRISGCLTWTFMKIWESPLKLGLSFLLPRVFWSFHYVSNYSINFYIWQNTKLSFTLHDNNKKIILKISNFSLMLILNFFAFEGIFIFSQCFFFKKKTCLPLIHLIITNTPYKKILMP